jgi:hypothetical protein
LVKVICACNPIVVKARQESCSNLEVRRFIFMCKLFRVCNSDLGKADIILSIMYPAKCIKLKIETKYFNLIDRCGRSGDKNPVIQTNIS